MPAPYLKGYFDLIDEVFIRLRKDQGEPVAARIAAYLREVRGLPAAASYHHSYWHVCYDWNDKEAYYIWVKHRVPASEIAREIDEKQLPGAEVLYRTAGRDTETFRQFVRAGLTPLACASCEGTYQLRPSPRAPYGPECPTCRTERLKKEAPERSGS